LLGDTSYPAGSLVLEAGCGVGAKTITLASRNPGARFVCTDISAESLAKAKEHNLDNVTFQQADIFAMPFPAAMFDHVFVCHVLEHLTDPVAALRKLRPVLKPGGTITVIEGDHGSCYWHPETLASQTVWQCLIRAQARLGGDSLIGRRLFPLLTEAGFADVRVSPRAVYCDASRQDWVDGFVRKTIIAMVEGVKTQSLELGLTDEQTWRQGIDDLNQVADRSDGTFNYMFFKAVAER
jgi:SAM-dependent methyltransferase